MKNKQKSNKQILFSFACGIAISMPLFFLIFWISSYFYENTRIEILKNPINQIGFIKYKQIYKIKSFDISYLVNNKRYTFSEPVNNKTYEEFDTGDEIEIIYNKFNPSKAIIKND